MEGKNGRVGKKKLKKEDDNGGDKYFRWTLEADRELANVLRDERNQGNKGDGGWKPAAYNSSSAILSAQFDKNISSDNVKNRVKTWRRFYGIVSDILGQSGFSWDATKQMITIDDENVWNDYVKSHTDAKKFRWKVIANWDDIVDLCGKDRATGEGAETPFEAEEDMGVEDVSDNDSNDDDQVKELPIGSDSNPPCSVDSRHKKRQMSTASVTSPQKKKEKKGGNKKNKVEDSFSEMASSVSDYFRSKPKALDIDEVYEVVSAIPELDEDTFYDASHWLMKDENKFRFLKKLPNDKKKNYLLKYMSQE